MRCQISFLPFFFLLFFIFKDLRTINFLQNNCVIITNCWTLDLWNSYHICKRSRLKKSPVFEWSGFRMAMLTIRNPDTSGFRIPTVVVASLVTFPCFKLNSVQIFVYLVYSGDQKTELNRHLNGQKEVGCQMVRYLNAIWIPDQWTPSCFLMNWFDIGMVGLVHRT